MKAQTSPSHLLPSMRSWAFSRIAVLDGNQSGAVAILCLAACAILFMTALVLYDAGHSARNKIDAQNAADTAAYSQAAVKARTMNMIMYTNVAKRSIVSLHNIYFGMWTAWITEMSAQCAKVLANGAAADECVEKTTLFRKEFYTDTQKFFDEAGDLARNELIALDKYQEYMTLLTPWWAWSEGLVRGARNGASFTSSYPPPPGLILTRIPNWINTAMNFLNMDSPYNKSSEVDAIPVSRTRFLDMCMIPGLSAGATRTGLAEFGANVLLHQQRSEADAKDPLIIAAGALLAISPAPGGGCFYSRMRFGGHMTPREPTADSDSSKDLLAKSNIVFSYKMAPEMRGQLRQNFNFINRDYNVRPNYLERGSGFWSLARGEFFFSKDAGLGAGTSPDPFKPQWTAKIRPLALPGEFADLNTNINAMFHDIAPYMAIASVLALGQDAITGGGGLIGDVQAIVGDTIYLEKATRSLDNSVINGLNK